MKTLEQIRLTERDRRCLTEAAATLKSKLPVERVILFGSKARGDAAADSDIDLLVLTSRPVTPELREALSDLAFQVSLRNDAVLSFIAASSQEWDNGLLRYTLIHQEVERDGCEI
jgi:predicted nucleotidyltransferase